MIRSSTRLLLAAGLCLCLGAATCWQQQSRAYNPEPQPVKAPEDLGQAALAHVRRLVALGPRYTGSKGWEQGCRYIVDQLEAMGLDPKVDQWTNPIEGISFQNISVTIKGQSQDRIVIGCHHDTKKYAGHPDPEDNFEFVGANDSGSGVGLLLLLAREISRRQNLATYELVFLDGEESLSVAWDKSRALFGSRHYVRRYSQYRLDHPTASKILAFVLLDMVGAKDLQIDNDSNSDAELKKIFRAAARTTGHAQYFFEHSHGVTDDHIPFVEAGIRAIDLIDLYDNPHWHEPTDTLEQLSARSLHIVGEVVLSALTALEERYVDFPAKGR